VGSQNKRITVEIIEKVKIKVPITKEGEFDLIKQKEIAERYQYIKELKKRVEEDKQKVNDLVVSIERERERALEKEIAIGKIFDLSVQTNTGKLTKSFIEENFGDIPVYGASKDENVIYGKIKDGLPIRYFENCLT